MEGNRPYPRCLQYDMFVAQKALNGRNLATEFFRRVAERKGRRLAEDEARTWTEMALIAYGVTLAPIYSFKHLGIVLVAEEDDCPAVVRNLRRARQKWARLTRILSSEGEDARTSGQIYLAVVKSVMIYS